MSYHYPQHVGKIVSPRRTNSERVANLISRYPGVSEQEANEIVTFMRTGRHLDMGLLTADGTDQPNLDAFMEDHKAHVRVKWWETAGVVGGIAVLLMSLWLLSEAVA